MKLLSLPVSIINGIYQTVASIYDTLIELRDKISTISGYFSGAIDALYTLIGIFMLFRIGISLITMLVDPDKINDKQEGAGKLLSRIIIAVVLVLTLNSFIFPLLSRVEDAVVDQIGGFAQKIFQVNAATTTHSINSSFIMNVEAKSHTCYYNLFYVDSEGGGQYSDKNMYFYPKALVKITYGETLEELYGKGGIYQATTEFRNTKAYFAMEPAGEECVCVKYKNGKHNSDCLEKICYKYGPVSIGADYKGISNSVATNNIVKSYDDTLDCPQIALKPGILKAPTGAKSYTFSGAIQSAHFTDKNSSTDLGDLALGWQLNAASKTSFKDATENLAKLAGNSENFLLGLLSPQTGLGATLDNYSLSEADYISRVTYSENEEGEIEENRENITGDVVGEQFEENGVSSGSKFIVSKDTDGKKFARAIASSFTKSSDTDSQNKWFDYKNGKFLVYSPSSEIKDGDTTTKSLENLYDGEIITFDILMGIIMAIVAIAFLVILMMDIVVRGLKLIILQIISPIAVLSYINPKDKIFNQWVKMYGSTYADLFLKLLAVSLIPYLLEAVLGNSNNPFAGHAFLKIIYILGIFLFAKGLPELISNVFGIKAAGGTFKEAAGIAKKGLGIGAGVAAGAIGASSILAHGGSLGSAANTIKAGFGGAKNVKSAKAEGIKQAYARRDSGQKWLGAEKNALKSHVPFMRTDKEKAERRIAELSRQQSTFKEADGLLEKDKGVMAASDILSQYRADGTVADNIKNYNQLDKDMYAKLKGYKKEGNNWVQRDANGVAINTTSDTAFARQIAEDTNAISNVDQISRMKENIAIAKTNALKDPSSAVGQQAKEVLKYNGGDGTDYDAYDKANKAAANEISDLKHDNFIS